METPHVSNRLVRLFTRYSRGYVRRHFHGVRLLKSHPLMADFRRLPAVVYLNHASWWDPLICLLLAAEYFPDRTSFAPIDAAALQKYRFLEKLGFFGIDPNSTRGAATFLRTAGNILESHERMVWVTPQGKFTDVRTRPAFFRGGLAALAGRVGPTVFLPMAVEYVLGRTNAGGAGRVRHAALQSAAPEQLRRDRLECGARRHDAGRAGRARRGFTAARRG